MNFALSFLLSEAAELGELGAYGCGPQYHHGAGWRAGGMGGGNDFADLFTESGGYDFSEDVFERLDAWDFEAGANLIKSVFNGDKVLLATLFLFLGERVLLPTIEREEGLRRYLPIVETPTRYFQIGQVEIRWPVIEGWEFPRQYPVVEIQRALHEIDFNVFPDVLDNILESMIVLQNAILAPY